MNDTENAERTQADLGPAERYREQSLETIRAEKGDLLDSAAKGEAYSIRHDIEQGKTSREEVEARWEARQARQEERFEEIAKAWEVDEGLMEGLDATLDDPNASDERVEAAADLKDETWARMEANKDEIRGIAFDQERVSRVREALGWGDAKPAVGGETEAGDAFSYAERLDALGQAWADAHAKDA